MTSQLPRGGQQGVRSVRSASRCGEGSGHQVAVQPPPLPSTLASRATCPAPLGAHVTETLSSSAFLLETMYSSCPRVWPADSARFGEQAPAGRARPLLTPKRASGGRSPLQL